ncbi:MAG: peptidylprolyl isomerase [Catalinimonas sp.]
MMKLPLPTALRHLVWLCLLALPLAAQQAMTVDKIVAKVDNYVVLRSDLEFTYQQVLSNGERDRGNLKCQLLENLIINKMLLAKADIDSVVVEEMMIDGELEGRMQMMLQQIGSRERAEELYGKTIDQLKEELRKPVREQMTIKRMQQTITADVKVTPSEVRKFFNNIPRDSLPFFSTEVEVGQIVKLPKVSRAQKQAVREKLLALRKRIQAGEDFAALAEQYSQDPGSAKNGGDLGFWGRGAMVPEFEGAALNLKVGQMSNPVESAFGFHLIRLEERKGTEYRARHILMKPESAASDMDAARDSLSAIRDRILNDSLPFSKAAKEYSDDEETKNSGGFFVDMATNTSRVPTEQLDPVIFFSIDTMEVGQTSMPTEFRTEGGEDALRIVYYKNRIAPHQANLREDYQKIYQAALNEKKQRVLGDWFENTRDEVYISIDPMYDECGIHKNTF